jgi:DNA-binding transcriptional LysR family regulator
VASILRRPAAEHAFCGFDASMSGSAQKQWLDSFAATRPVVFRSNDLFALYRAARAGLGIALLPHFLVEARDGLRPLTLEGVTFERPVSLIMHPNLRRSPRVRAVAQFLADAVVRERELLAGPLPASR